MQSFAFWYKKNDSSSSDDKVSAVLNFNLWSECGWKNNITYLDIGFKLSENSLQKIDELCFFVPFKTDIEKLLDLGEQLKERKLLSTVFNENYKIKDGGNKDFIVEKAENDESVFRVYNLDIKHDLSVKSYEDGSKIILPIKKNSTLCNSKDSFYFRFRIKIDNCPELIHKYETKSKALQSLFNTIYSIDFRYNNVRSLDDTLLEEINNSENGKINVKSVHFLLITNTFVNLLSSDYKSARKLEKDVWKSYIEGNATDDLIAYHYKESAEKTQQNDGKDFIDSSEFFIKYSKEKSVITLYIIFTLIVGLTGSLFANFINSICQLLFVSAILNLSMSFLFVIIIIVFIRKLK